MLSALAILFAIALPALAATKVTVAGLANAQKSVKFVDWSPAWLTELTTRC